MTIYSLSACENLIADYLERGGTAYTVEEGCLGLGLMVLSGRGLKTTIIKEIFLTTYTCGHTMRKYNRCPEKYQKYI
ncbi:MAG: hypothetical protein IJS19_00325 [Muribaculaceae bacterium]|nr:hypothetical protein [Muribaculaceae bacterium]